MEFVIFALFAMQLDYCNIQRVYMIKGRNSQRFQVQGYLFYIFKLNNATYIYAGSR